MEKKTVIIEVQTEDGVKQLDRLSAKFDEVYGDVLPLTASIGELEDQLYQMALEGKKGTEEFNLLAQEAGRLKKTLQQVDMEVDALAMTTANKLGGSLGGVASGFELVQGAMGAMGAESQAVEQALLKVQSAMAIAQGIQGVKEALPAFKAMGSGAISAFKGMSAAGKAFALTGIGLVITALAVAADAMDVFSSSTDDAEQQQKELEKALDKTNKQIDDQARLTSTLSDIIDKNTQRDLISAMNRGASEQELNKIKREGAKERLRILEDEEAQAKKLYLKKSSSGSQKEFEAAEKKLLEIQKETSSLRLQIEAEEATERYNKRKEANEKYKQLEEERRDKVKETRDKEAEERKKKAEEEKALRAEEDASFADFAQKAKERRDKANDETNKSYDDQRAAQQKVIDDLRAQKEKDDIKEAERIERNKQFAIESSSTMFGLIQDLADAFAGQSEESQRKAFKIRKAASIAQTTIETYKAAQSAYASQIIVGDPTSPIRGTIAAAFAVASGLAKVKAISATQFGGGGSTSASGGGSGAPSLPQSNPAQFNIVGNSGTNQLNGLGGGVTQAYVVSGDVTTAQSLERNKITTATL